MVERGAAAEPGLQAAQVGLDDLGVALKREDRAGQDVDALGDGLLDDRQCGRRGRYLDDQVRAIDGGPEPLDLSREPGWIPG
jgi:hypothetical protein